MVNAGMAAIAENIAYVAVAALSQQYVRAMAMLCVPDSSYC